EPLGEQRFKSETGIRRTDWSKFWARWSDALREAGFVPNEFGVAYENPKILECYAKFAREIGRLPAWSDLKLKAYNDPEFPSNFLVRRFGSKEELLKQLVEYCRSQGGHEDVIRLCEGTSRARRKFRLRKSLPGKRSGSST